LARFAIKVPAGGKQKPGQLLAVLRDGVPFGAKTRRFGAKTGVTVFGRFWL